MGLHIILYILLAWLSSQLLQLVHVRTEVTLCICDTCIIFTSFYCEIVLTQINAAQTIIRQGPEK